MSHTLRNIYASYTEEFGDIDKILFRDICSDFNILSMNYILEGKKLNLGFNLSSIYIVRKERDPRSPRINWGESNKYKKELLDKGEDLYNKETDTGTKWHIYHTDEFYCKFHWNKGRCKVKNKSVYRFDATRGIKGNKEKLIHLLKTDDLAYLKFKKH